RWGLTPHVSSEIIWISPIVDVALFLLAALVIAIFSGFRPAEKAMATMVFVVVLISIYNWTRLTERLSYVACVLLSLGAATFLTRVFRKNPGRYIRFLSRNVHLAAIVWLVSFAGIQGGKRLIENRKLAALTPASPTAPNVLIILVDTLRAD